MNDPRETPEHPEDDPQQAVDALERRMFGSTQDQERGDEDPGPDDRDPTDADPDDRDPEEGADPSAGPGTAEPSG